MLQNPPYHEARDANPNDDKNFVAAGHSPDAVAEGLAFRPDSKPKTYPQSGKQITRSRVSYSCYTCRRRKVKCDKVHPVCGNCQKTQSQCQYDPSSLADAAQPRRRSGSAKHGTKRRKEAHTGFGDGPEDFPSPYGSAKGSQRDHEELGADSQIIAQRLDRLTSMIERLSRTEGSPSLLELDKVIQSDRLLHGIERGRGTINSATVRRSSSSTSSRSNPASRASSPDRQGDNNNNEDFPIPQGLATDPVDPVGALNIGHLSLEDGGKSRYVGTTYWAYISDEINELNQLLRNQNRAREESTTPDEEPSPMADDTGPEVVDIGHRHRSKPSWSSPGNPSFRTSTIFPFGDSPQSQHRVIEADALEHVPTKRQSHILYKAFMSGVNAISPVLHPPTVLKMYERFWQWYDNQGQTGDFPGQWFIPLLYAIWYGGSVTVSLRTIHAEFGIKSRSDLSSRFHDEVTKWLKRISLPRCPSVPGLQAFLIVQTILSKEEEPLTSSLFISLALRVAQTMGLHRDPAQFGISGCAAETRRRVWWHIVHMDGVVAMSSGLPPLVSDENYWDVRITSEVKDTLLGSAEIDEYERMVDAGKRRPDQPDDPTICGGSSMLNVYYLCAKGKYVMARAVRKILKIQLGTEPVTRKDMENLRSILIDLRADLHAIIDRIPVSKTIYDHNNAQSSLFERPPEVWDVSTELPNGGPSCLEQYHSPVLVAFHKWARILLALFVHKAFCVAYQPFLKNAKSKIWPAARQCALHHCHGFMDKFVQLATDPDFQPFQWSWPGNHQPMHATMIMLIDLYERPHAPEASKSRAFIDKIFSLSGPDGGVVGGENGISTSRPLRDGGREAWDMMRRLREKAWLKAGLDPQLLWTEHAQAQAHATNRSSSADRYSTHKPNDYKESPPRNFADEYYTLIKEPQEHNKSPRRTRFDNDALKHESKPSVTFSSGAPGEYAAATFAQNQRYSTAGTKAFTQPKAGNSGWPSSPSFPSFTYAQTHRPSSSQDFASAVPGIYNGTPMPQNSQLNETTTFMTDISAAPPPPTTAIADLQGNPLPGDSIPGNTTAFKNDTTALDQHKFDWDQWDAVFGQYLPVVDGFMDLERGPANTTGNNNNNNNNTGINPGDPFAGLGAEGTSGFSAHELGFDSGDVGNWADFG